MLARLEGLFVEPASASAIAGLKKVVEAGLVGKDELIVCIATGHGLKDPDIVVEAFQKPVEVEAELESLQKVIGVG